jgi:AcrR family transcriptional regulator
VSPVVNEQLPAIAMRERIVRAAAEVLAVIPLSKLTMEDVARSAGIARQTIYKHFATRDDVVVALFVEQVEQRHRPVLSEIHAAGRSASLFTDLIEAELRLANDWTLLSRTFDPNIAPRIAELVLGSPALTACNRATWRPLLADYRAAGILRDDVDLDRAIHWLTYQYVWLLSHPTALSDDPDDRRAYIHTFITGALVRA